MPSPASSPLRPTSPFSSKSPCTRGDKVVQRGEIVGLELFARVLVEGPFQAADGIAGGSREAILEGVRLEVGQQAVGRGRGHGP